MFNHSCSPNVAYRIRTAGGVKMEFMARTAIKSGEELFISYFNPKMPKQQRREKLLQYGFLCRCSRCETEADATE
jgi:SET domain-containing protein